MAVGLITGLATFLLPLRNQIRGQVLSWLPGWRIDFSSLWVGFPQNLVFSWLSWSTSALVKDSLNAPPLLSSLVGVLRIELLEGPFGSLAQLRSLVVCRCTLAFSSVRAYVHHAAHMNPEAGIEEKIPQHMIQARTVKMMGSRR